MKLVRYGNPGKEKPGLIDLDGKLRDLSGVVPGIGTRARYVSKKDALAYVAGYCVVNDVSEREYQLERGPQWDKGKGCDTFGPIGPWLVTPDEFENVQRLDMWLDVNGKRMQTGST